MRSGKWARRSLSGGGHPEPPSPHGVHTCDAFPALVALANMKWARTTLMRHTGPNFFTLRILFFPPPQQSRAHHARKGILEGCSASASSRTQPSGVFVSGNRLFRGPTGLK